MPLSAPRTLIVRSLAPASARSALLALSAAGGYGFAAGQAVLLGVPGVARKPYSIASSPADAHERGVLEFLIGTDPDRAPFDLGGLSPGAPMHVEGPLGSFVLPEPPPVGHLLLFAGGTGIAPLRSMWRDVLAGDTASRITLAYSVRTSADVAFGEEIEDLVAQRRLEALVTCSREAPPVPRYRAGRLDLDVVQSLVGDDAALACVCGPPGFVRDLVAMLGRCGLGDEQILREGW